MCCKKPGQILFVDRARRHATSRKHISNLHKRFNPVPFIPFFLCPVSHCDAKARPVRPKRHRARKTRTKAVQPAAGNTDVTPTTSAASSDTAEPPSHSEDADTAEEAEQDEDDEDDDTASDLSPTNTGDDAVGDASREREGGRSEGHGHAVSYSSKRSRADVEDDPEVYIDYDATLSAEEMSPPPTKRSRIEAPPIPRSESSFELPDDFGGFCALQPIFDLSGVPKDDMSWLFMPCPTSSIDTLPKRLRKFLPTPQEIAIPA
ncbi:hypothetical protein EIP86_004965 [Pleurotus ostreatoroseus]|nr:hypothetical protein EIP86_004965 [Pleurotus ostreatoroseus]